MRLINGDTKPLLATAEYIWLDGNNPQEIRSKTKVIEIFPTEDSQQLPVPMLTDWSFDGSSTIQAEGNNSDCFLKPVHYVLDPFQKGANYLVLCEVYKDKETPHETNTRAYLRQVLESGGSKSEGLFGFEQEYFLYRPDHYDRGLKPHNIIGWRNTGTDPHPQGHYYCGVGSDNVEGREIANEHLRLCMEAGLLICGLNAEVALGQWEFQIGYRDFQSDDDVANGLIASDHLIFARYILQRLCEKYDLAVEYHPKPIKGDWNGSGLHTNFSTWATREKGQGRTSEGIPSNIQALIDLLEPVHKEHMELYGIGNEERLTGLHETCSHTEFKSGGSDRGASIRIPIGVLESGYGYLEDRRPSSNADPYLVSGKLLATASGLWIPTA